MSSAKRPTLRHLARQAARRALTLVTCQAHNTVPISRALADYLSVHAGAPVEFRADVPWRDAYRGVAEGAFDIAWICGWPYTQLAAGGAAVDLLAAPVMAGGRYGGRPVYFSDVVVQRDSPFTRFTDLRGASWAYNEPGSQSGYHITRYELARLGEDGSFFGRVVASGAHQRSLAMILAGDVDASAIDSTVLEWELAHAPGLAEKIRIIATWGPSPSPPLVAATAQSRAALPALRRALLELPASPAGRHLLQSGGLAAFAVVSDADYDPIRAMEAVAAGIDLVRT